MRMVYEIMATDENATDDDTYSSLVSARHDILLFARGFVTDTAMVMQDRRWFDPGTGAHCVISLECEPTDKETLERLLWIIAKTHFDDFNIAQTEV